MAKHVRYHFSRKRRCKNPSCSCMFYNFANVFPLHIIRAKEAHFIRQFHISHFVPHARGKSRAKIRSKYRNSFLQPLCAVSSFKCAISVHAAFFLCSSLVFPSRSPNPTCQLSRRKTGDININNFSHLLSTVYKYLDARNCLLYSVSMRFCQHCTQINKQ